MRQRGRRRPSTSGPLARTSPLSSRRLAAQPVPLLAGVSLQIVGVEADRADRVRGPTELTAAVVQVAVEGEHRLDVEAGGPRAQRVEAHTELVVLGPDHRPGERRSPQRQQVVAVARGDGRDRVLYVPQERRVVGPPTDDADVVVAGEAQHASDVSHRTGRITATGRSTTIWPQSCPPAVRAASSRTREPSRRGRCSNSECGGRPAMSFVNVRRPRAWGVDTD